MQRYFGRTPFELPLSSSGSSLSFLRYDKSSSKAHDEEHCQADPSNLARLELVLHVEPDVNMKHLQNLAIPYLSVERRGIMCLKEASSQLANSCQKLPKVFKRCQKLTIVSQSCPMMPKVAKNFGQHLTTFEIFWQLWATSGNCW